MFLPDPAGDTSYVMCLASSQYWKPVGVHWPANDKGVRAAAVNRK